MERETFRIKRTSPDLAEIEYHKESPISQRFGVPLPLNNNGCVPLVERSILTRMHDVNGPAHRDVH